MRKIAFKNGQNLFITKKQGEELDKVIKRSSLAINGTTAIMSNVPPERVFVTIGSTTFCINDVSFITPH